jgi:hypothetical protein
VDLQGLQNRTVSLARTIFGLNTSLLHIAGFDLCAISRSPRTACLSPEGENNIPRPYLRTEVLCYMS